MLNKPASLIVAAATLVLASVGSTAASALPNGDEFQQRSPRVSPDEAERRGRELGRGRPIDTRPRDDGNYSVLVERNGRVREVVVDGQTGQARQGNQGQNRSRNDNDNDSNNQRRRPN